MDQSKQNRNPKLDIARIVAVLAVVMIHCSADFLTRHEQYTNEFFCGNIFDSISRFGVPLFIMISGALFLDEGKEIHIKNILLKNVLGLAVITVIWSAIHAVMYNIISPLLRSEAMNFTGLVDATIEGHFHLWYLYMIMGLYVITPVLKKVVCKENKDIVLYFIVVSFIVQFFMPTVSKVCTYCGIRNLVGEWIGRMGLSFFGGYITYFLAGWYIVHVGVKGKYLKYSAYGFGILSLLCVVLYVHYTGDFTNAYEYISVPAFLYSTSIFLGLNNMKVNLSEKATRIVENISKLTFGVYLSHILVLDIFDKYFPYRKNCVMYLMVCYMTVVCVSFIGSYIISKMPIIKRIIRA